MHPSCFVASSPRAFTRSATARPRWAAPLCLAAAIAYAVDTAAAAHAQVEHLPQQGVQLEQKPQSGVRLPQQSLRQTPISGAAKPAPVVAPQRQPKPPRAPALRAKATASQAQPVVALEGPLQLKLDTTLRLAALSAPPTASAVHGAALTTPPWWGALLDALDKDERDHAPQPLLDLLDAHAAAVRARADAQLATRLGWALYRAQRFDQAADWFALARAKDSTATSAQQGEFYALQRAGALERAFAAAAGDTHLQSARADVAVQLALRARDRGDAADAVHWLRQAIALGKDDDGTRSLLAWSLLQSGQPAQAADVFAPLYAARPQDRDLAQGLYLSLQRSAQTARLQTLGAQPGALADLLRRQQALHWRDIGLARDAAALDPQADPRLAGAAAPELDVGGAIRDKSGAAGTSQLRTVQLPALRLRWTTTLGSWEARVADNRVDAGAAPPAAQVGSTRAGDLGSPARQSVGASGEIRFTQLGPRGFGAALGITPTAGAVAPTWTGALGWRDIGSDHDWRIALQRTPVDDSVLSLTGLRDPATGLSWGRVMRDSLVAGGYQTLWPNWNASAQLRLAQLRGVHVANNTQIAASAGLARNFTPPGLRYLSIGPTLAFERYERNLSGFTWGQGGYFSPQGFTSAALQAIFETHQDRPWMLAGQIQLGWQSVRQDAAACFALAPPIAAPSCTPTAASRSSGIATSAALQSSALLSPHWALQVSAQLRTGPAYQDRAIYLGLRYFFAPRKALFSTDLPTPGAARQD